MTSHQKFSKKLSKILQKISKKIENNQKICFIIWTFYKDFSYHLFKM